MLCSDACCTGVMTSSWLRRYFARLRHSCSLAALGLRRSSAHIAGSGHECTRLRAARSCVAEPRRLRPARRLRLRSASCLSSASNAAKPRRPHRYRCFDQHRAVARGAEHSRGVTQRAILDAMVAVTQEWTQQAQRGTRRPAGARCGTSTSRASPSSARGPGIEPKSYGNTAPWGSTRLMRNTARSWAYLYLLRLPAGVSMTTWMRPEVTLRAAQMRPISSSTTSTITTTPRVPLG